MPTPAGRVRLKVRIPHTDADWEGFMPLARSIKWRIDTLRLSLGDARDERTAMAATLFLLFGSGTVRAARADG